VVESLGERRLKVLVTTAPKAQFVSIDLTMMGKGRMNLAFFVLSFWAYAHALITRFKEVKQSIRKIFPFNPTDNDTVTVFKYF
jgi:hypothetical protein